ncbi:hypothetical protein ABW19_dt0204227 [Dactylella cylindrospora]|nr:hypothetical protein ABW19_dt0204227 [Dactylella cylindrospora]
MVKVILTGVTGFLGEEVLRQCVANPDIAQIMAIARRDLKDEFKDEKKITLIKMQDLSEYPDEVIEQLKGAEGCIWCLGTIPGKGETTMEYLRKVNVDWTVAAAEAFTSKWTLPDDRKFRFIYTSGVLMPDPDKLDQKMWFSEELRKLRGHADKAIFDMSKEGKLEGMIGKPAFITENEPLLARLSFGMGSISRQALAACYIDALLNGIPDKKDIWRNADLKKRGGDILSKQKAAIKK